MIELSALLFAAAVVGFLIGTVGIGGVLLVPALISLAKLSAHEASATALCTFIFTGILGTLLFQRRGSIHWRQTAAVCAGAVPFGYLGARASALVSDATLLTSIAVLIIFAGGYVIFPRNDSTLPKRPENSYALLFLIGIAAGFGSGFSGAGGPLFSVPLMLMAGFAPLASIGTSQVLQIFSAGSATLAHATAETIRWGLVGQVTGAELIGVVLGVRLAHAVSPPILRKGAAVLCIAVGVWMLLAQFRGG